MVAIQLKRLVSLITLCTLVSSSTIQRVQRADNLDNVSDNPNAQNGSPSTPRKDVGPPAEIQLNLHPNDDGNHNGQAGSHSSNRMNFPISHRSVESTNKNPDDKKPNSDAGSGASPIPHLNIPGVPVKARPPRSIEYQDKRTGVDPPISIHPNVIHNRAVVENYGNQMKRVDIDGEPTAKAEINKNFQDGQAQETEGLGELS